MSQDTNVSNLIINKLTKQQFEGITTPDPTQLYFITDDNGISSLDDISISSLSNGQILKYNSTSGKWENANIPNELPSQSGQSGKYLTTNGSFVSWAAVDTLPSQTSQSGKYLTTNGTTASWANVPTEIPTQTGNSGKFLTTNGSTVSWATVDALPSQTSQSGKFLTTNGTTASWASISVPSKISDLTDDTSTYPIDKADTLTGLTATVSELNIMDGVTVTASDINSVTSKIGLTALSIDSGSTNYLGYNNSTGKFSAKVDTTVGTTSTNLVTSGAVNTALGNKLDKKPDGTNNILDTNNKITTTYIPDFILGQMLYAGTFVPNTAVATLTTNAKTKLGTASNTITLTNNTTAITGYAANEGNYYICSADGTFASISFVTGDWLVSTGSSWQKIDNTDAVTGVKGNAESTYRTGNVNITADNVMPTQTGNSGKYLTTDGTNVSWGTVDALPSQTSQSGKFLTTNGTTASWASVDTLPSQTSQSGKYLTTDGSSASWSDVYAMVITDYTA